MAGNPGKDGKDAGIFIIKTNVINHFKDQRERKEKDKSPYYIFNANVKKKINCCITFAESPHHIWGRFLKTVSFAIRSEMRGLGAILTPF